jgi:Glutathione S-transferase, N-terminal domain
MTLKLYYHPASTTCRPIMLLVAVEKIAVDYQLVDLFNGENYQPAFTAINPNQAVPFFEDGEFALGESSAILKCLADKQNSPAYPKDLRMRARVNERMDWFNTGLYRDLGYGFIYPQVIDAYRYPEPEVQSATLAHAREKVNKWNEHPRCQYRRPEKLFRLRRQSDPRRLFRRVHTHAGRRDQARLLRISESHALARHHEVAALLSRRQRRLLFPVRRHVQRQAIRRIIIPTPPDRRECRNDQRIAS